MAETKASAVKSQTVKAVYGRMVEPHTGEVFDQKPSELLKLTPWVQSQIETGKLVIVTGKLA